MLTYSNGTRHSQNEGLIAYAGLGAKINLYAGTRPPNANTAITTQTLIVSMTISGVFGTDTNGTITLGAVTPGLAANTGTVTFFRIFKSDGTTVVMDGSVGESGADMNLNTVNITATQQVSLGAGTIIRANQ